MYDSDLLRNQKKIHRPVHWALMITIVTLISLLSGEAIYRDGLFPVWDWMTKQPMAVAVNLVLLAAITATGMGILGKVPGGCLSGIMFIGYSLINRYKSNILGFPVVSSDFRLGAQHLDTLIILMGKYGWAFWPLVAVILAGLILIDIKMPLGGWTARSISLVVGLAVLIPVFGSNFLGQTGWIQPTWFTDLLQRKKFEYIGWDLQRNTYQNGQLLAITWNFEQSLVMRPRNYNPQAIAKRYAESLKSSEKRPDVIPDVIVLMSEAWWDPQVMITPNAAPFSWTGLSPPKGTFFGEVISPVVGGMTCNAEFEFLTGYSMAFLPLGTIPYVDYLLEPGFSLARHFRTMGYQTLAIHPFERNFWFRDRVYEYLGFDRYIAIDDFIDPEITGYYVSDRTLVQRILDELSDSDQMPKFIFAISMQNHLPFYADKYPESTLTGYDALIPENLAEDSREALNAFIVGVHDAWKAFTDLADGLKKRGRSAVLVQFGDHLPAFDRVYIESDFVTNRDSRRWSPSERLRMHTVPLAVWETREQADLRIDFDGPISLSFLGSRLLAAFGLLSRNPYLMVNLENSYKNPVLLRELLGNSPDTGNAISRIDTQALNMQEWLQYDGMFGQKLNLYNETILVDIESDKLLEDSDEI